MEPIRVPAPSPSAFNKHRRISDLIDAQLKHFQHLERRGKLDVHPTISEDIHTEAGAARYIAQVTNALLTRARANRTSPGPSAKPAKAKSTACGPLKIATPASTSILPAVAATTQKDPVQRKAKKRKNP